MQITEFIHDLTWATLPQSVQKQARRCLLDTLGAAIGGRQIPVSHIVHDFAAVAFAGRGARLWLDGRLVSPPGAALANGMTIDALDIHDGHSLVKGHAGAAIVPAALATLSLAPGQPVSGAEMLAAIVVGYEVALRAGQALHRTACDYHTSGAWNALGCAALTARRQGSSAAVTDHALGIAEYHGPRSPMMRCIDYPTMVKDGSGWGAMAGVSAAMLAQAGFTGAPAAIVEEGGVADLWADLGQRWLILEQYFKPHAVCRWAQPAVAGALALQRTHGFDVGSIERIRVMTFHEAVCLRCQEPATTEEAQYGLPFPLAAALVHGRLGAEELSGPGLSDRRVLALARRVELVEDPAYSAQFPSERFARVLIKTRDGDVFDSGDVEPTWEAADPPSDDQLRAKFRWLAEGLSPARVAQLEAAIWNAQEAEASRLAELLAPAGASYGGGGQ